MVNETYRKGYQAIEELPSRLVEGIYDLMNPFSKTDIDGFRRPTLLDKTSEFPLEVIDTRSDQD